MKASFKTNTYACTHTYNVNEGVILKKKKLINLVVGGRTRSWS